MTILDIANDDDSEDDNMMQIFLFVEELAVRQFDQVQWH